MMLKVSDGYLDFDATPEVERQIKLFEDIDTSDGDYSYSFDLQPTSNNIRKLSAPFPDNVLKLTYTQIPAQLLTDEGLQLYDGYLRIEQINPLISVSFFAGNNNWFGLLAAPISDIDFSEYDQEQNTGTIALGFTATDGIAFPLVDHGPLVTRSYRNLKVEDFVAGIYVKTVFKKIFQSHSIKIQGDLVTDPLYNSIITIKSGKSQSEIDGASAYAGQTSAQARPGENIRYKMLFNTDSDYPYFDGSLDALDLSGSQYIAPFKMTANLEINYKPSINDSSYSNRTYIYINGVFTFVDIGLAVGGLYNSATVGGDLVTTKRLLTLEAGDIVEIYTEWQQSGGSTQNNVLSGSFKITPKFIYSVFGNSVVPKWTQAQYVSNILRMFNVLPSYESKTKTLTLNYFNKIKDTVPIDLSSNIAQTVVDYKDFISSYAKRNLLSYNQVDFEDIRQYNVRNFLEYGTGVIESSNEFLEESTDLIQSDFSAPIDYLNPVFDMSISRTNLLTAELSDSYSITSVTDNSGTARLNLDENNIALADLVRVTESNNPNYNGDWKVTAKGTGYLEFDGLDFDTDATATIQRIDINTNDTDEVFLLWNCPTTFLTDFTTLSPFKFETGNMLYTAMAYFSLLNTGRTVNSRYKQSLSFGAVQKPQFYQRTIVDTYWSLFSGIVNDPVKLICQANIPYNIFLKIDFLRQITIKTLETSNQYYLNRITGYKAEERQCEIQLIKLPPVPREVSSETPVIPTELTPEFVQNANAAFSAGSTTTLTYTFSTGLISTNRVIGMFCCRTKVGNPETHITSNQGSIDACVFIGGYASSNFYLFQISGFPGGNTSLVLTFSDASHRPSNVNGCAFEIAHGTLGGTNADGGSSSNTTGQTMNVGLVPNQYSMIFCGAAFNAVPGFCDVSVPPGVTQFAVTGNNASQSCFGALIFPAGPGFPTQPEWVWVNSVGSILEMYEITYI